MTNNRKVTPERGSFRRVLESLIELAVEIAREGREGRRIGTLFTLGDEQVVLAKSRSLILDGIHDPQFKLEMAQQNQRACPLASIPTRTVSFRSFSSL